LKNYRAREEEKIKERLPDSKLLRDDRKIVRVRFLINCELRGFARINPRGSA
jgi:hypothetical protein